MRGYVGDCPRSFAPSCRPIHILIKTVESQPPWLQRLVALCPEAWGRVTHKQSFERLIEISRVIDRHDSARPFSTISLAHWIASPSRIITHSLPTIGMMNSPCYFRSPTDIAGSVKNDHHHQSRRGAYPMDGSQPSGEPLHHRFSST